MLSIQDSTAPLRGPGEKKDEDREEESECGSCVRQRSSFPLTMGVSTTAEFSPFYGIDKGAVLQEAR